MARKLIGQHTRTLLHTHTDKDTARKTSTSLHINVLFTQHGQHLANCDEGGEERQVKGKSASIKCFLYILQKFVCNSF